LNVEDRKNQKIGSIEKIRGGAKGKRRGKRDLLERPTRERKRRASARRQKKGKRQSATREWQGRQNSWRNHRSYSSAGPSAMKTEKSAWAIVAAAKPCATPRSSGSCPHLKGENRRVSFKSEKYICGIN